MTSTLTPTYEEVSLHTLGKLALSEGTFARPKPLLLLAYLALEGPKSKRFLSALFFPESVDRAANLRQTLARLRRAEAEQELIQSDAQRVWTPLQSDAAAFLGALETRDLARAVALYEGPFLAGTQLPELGTELEEWVYATREVLAGALRGALLTLAEEAFRLGEVGAATRDAERAYRTEGVPELEPELFSRLYTLLVAGRSPLAAALRREAEEVGLELSHTPEPFGEPVPAPQPKPLPTRGGLFVGREAEQRELAELLTRPDVRLLSLCGPGGVGKTRLVLEFAATPKEQFRDGVVFVPLEVLTSPAQLPEALASALELTLQPDTDTLVQVAQAVGSKTQLFVLDNFEHLVSDMTALSQLLEACPNLKLLVTTRERLNLADEWVFSLGGLAFPSYSAVLEDATHYDALQLFVQRAKRARLSFTLTTEALPPVLTICELLQGSPLGLELAAGWVKLLSCEEIAQEIQKSLDFLSATTRDIPTKHRSIRAVFESSWARLSAHEQAVLKKLSVFRGGFTRQAAAEVAGATLPDLASLADKSLLRVSARGRHDRHMLLYNYTQEKLAENPKEEAEIRDKHTAFFLRLAEEAESYLRTDQQKVWLERLEENFSNLHEAFVWLLSSATTTLAAFRLFNALGTVFTLHYTTEGRIWVKEALEHTRKEPSPEQAILLHFAGTLSRLQAKYDEACVHYRDSLELLRVLGEKAEEARVLGYLAMVFTEKGDYEAARQNYEMVLAYAQGSNNTALLTSISHNLGLLQHTQGHYDQAISSYQKSLEGFSALGDKVGVTKCLINLGFVAHDQGDHFAAMRYCQDGLALARELAIKLVVADALVGTGMAATALGQKSKAYEYLRESLELSRDVDNKLTMIYGLESLAILFGQDDPARAAQVWGTAEQERSTLQSVRMAGDKARFDSELAKLSDILGKAGFAAAWKAGRQMGLGAAVEGALETTFQ